MMSLTKLTQQTELPSYNADPAFCLSKNHKAASWPRGSLHGYLPQELRNILLAFSQCDKKLIYYPLELSSFSVPNH